jgi:hypothetical protein
MYKILGSDQSEYGPVTAEQVGRWIAERRLNAQSLARPEGAATWQPLASFPEFAAALASVSAIPARLPTQWASSSSGATNGMAIASLVMGGLSLPCCGCGLFGLLAVVFGAVALSQLNRQPQQSGKPLAVAGIVLGALGLVTTAATMTSGFFTRVLERFLR